jgi:hypothetical protein
MLVSFIFVVVFCIKLSVDLKVIADHGPTDLRGDYGIRKMLYIRKKKTYKKIRWALGSGDEIKIVRFSDDLAVWPRGSLAENLLNGFLATG